MTPIQPAVEAERFYCIKEACRLLDIHRNTLRKYTRSGDIHCRRVTCREIYYSGREILQLWINVKLRKHND